MSIRSISPPIETQFGDDSPAQFAELKTLDISVDYRPTGAGGAIEQWVKIRIRMECWQGGASASEGAVPLRIDTFDYEVKPGDNMWPLTQANWDTLRGYAYDNVQTNMTDPLDDPNCYARGTVFLD